TPDWETGSARRHIPVGTGTAVSFRAASASTFPVTTPSRSDGAVTVDVAASVAVDAADNENEAAEQFSILYDSEAPTVTISSGAPDPTNSSPIPVAFEFSEDVTDFVIGDITIGNGTAGNFVAVSASTYTVDITPTTDGTVTVD